MRSYKLRTRLRRAWWNLRGMAIEVGEKTRLDPTAQLRLQDGGSITVGRNCRIHRGVIVDTHGGDIVLEDNVSLNPYCVIYGNGGVSIGRDCRVAAHTLIVASNHGFEDRDIPIRHQPMSAKGITVEEDVWIGGGCRIVDGCTIGRGCVIGAGTVVTKSTEPYGIYVGTPATRVRERGQDKP